MHKKINFIMFMALLEANAEEISSFEKSPTLEHKNLQPYNYQQREVHQFIEKIRQPKILVHSELQQDIWVRFKILKDGYVFKKQVKIHAQKSTNLAGDEVCLDIKVLDPHTHNSTVYTNLIQSKDLYNLSLSYTEIPYRPLFIQFADFKPTFLNPISQFENNKNPLFLPYSPIYYAINPPTNLAPDFIKQYNGNLRYFLECICRNEGIDSVKYHERLNNLYRTNFLPYLYNRLVAKVVEKGKPITLEKSIIPPIVHSIWFTHADKPIEFPEKYVRYAIESAKACPPKEGYKHILWVKSKKKLPQTVLRLLGSAIDLKEIKQLRCSPLYKIIKEEIKNKRFGRASDIARVVIMEKFGGVYRDTDYRIHHSLAPLLLSYTFFAAREPMSSFICNAFFAAVPHHGLIQDYVDMIERNFDPARVPEYIKRIPDNDGFATILITGPGAFTTVVAQGIGHNLGRDVILPSQLIVPTPLESYPQKEVVKDGNPVPASSFGVHYWDSSWTTHSTYGSRG